MIQKEDLFDYILNSDDKHIYFYVPSNIGFNEKIISVEETDTNKINAIEGQIKNDCKDNLVENIRKIRANKLKI